MVGKDDIGRNPLVLNNPEDTLEHCLAVLAFLQWTKTTESNVIMSGPSLAGEYYVLDCVRDALKALSRDDSVRARG
jgi:hypothetical protein